MKKIKLTKGKFALVDNEDFEYLNQWKWHLCRDYAIRRQYFKGDKIYARKVKIIWMHRLIINTPPGMETDHINGNGLDNQKNNLRIVTKSQNQHNRKLSKQNTSGFTGVFWMKESKKWMARTYINGENKYCGG